MAEKDAPAVEGTRRWLPSRPRFGDWFYAGCFAGTALGTAELLPLMLQGERPSLAFASLVVALPAVLTAFLTLCLAPVFLGRVWTFSRSQLVGLVLGPLLCVAASGGVLETLRNAWGAGLVYSLVVTLGAGMVGLVGTKAGALLEQRGLPLHGPWVWSIAAIFIALTEQSLTLPPGRGVVVVLLAVGALVVATLAGIERAKQVTKPPRGWSGSLRVLLVCAFVLVVGPRSVPFLLSNPESPPPVHAQPNVLLVAWPGNPELLRARVQESSALSQFTSRGVVYDQVVAIRDDSHAVPDWLMSRDQIPVLANWSALGYETIEIVTRADSRAGANQRDWSSGGQNWLASSGQRTTAGRLLTASGWSGHRAHRGPEELLSRAESWLLRQADEPSTGPFAMYLDFRGGEGLDGATFDRQFDRMLQSLEFWGGLERCVIAVVVESDRGARSALLRPAATDLGADRGIRVRQPVHPAELSEAILEAARSGHPGRRRTSSYRP